MLEDRYLDDRNGSRRKQKLCVLGLGYIGLPTAAVFANNGFDVIGVDVDARVVKTLNQGNLHIEEPGLRTLVAAAVRSGNFRAVGTPVEADVFIIAVPTPVTADKRADLSYVEAAAHAIVPYLRPDSLVILESTSPPRTTADVVAPILSESGLEIGRELFVAHCPERVLPGRILKELIENDRVVGGITPHCADRAKALYSAVVDGKIHRTTATTAEMVKVMENTFRDVNIALANELALISQELDVNAWEVIDLANRHPRVNIHAPGPGVGGHCISVDPWFLVEKAPEQAKIVAMARHINDRMPDMVAELIMTLLSGIDSPKVAVMGVAFKGNVDDTRESPATEVIAHLKANGVEVAVYDPRVQRYHLPLSTLESAFGGADCAVLLADHSEYRQLDLPRIRQLMRTSQVLDTRRGLDLREWTDAGFRTHLLGDRPVKAGSIPAATIAAPVHAHLGS
jgi:UDP-N-acetyl-D-mannosaminuronic acid dehydrogenase